MKKLLKITFCLVFVLVFASFAQAQKLQTAKGYFCGSSEGDGGYIEIRVGNAVRGFYLINEEPEVKFVGFNERQKGLQKSLLGAEMIVSYVFKKPKDWNSSMNVVRKLTLTGKVNKKTKSCGFGDE